MEQAPDLELAVRFTKRDGEWFAALGDELDSPSLETLEEYRAELEARLCNMDHDYPDLNVHLTPKLPLRRIVSSGLWLPCLSP